METFTGYFEHAIDEKGRLSIPSPFRGVLAGLQDEYLVVTRYRLPKSTRRCLDVYPLSTWRGLVSRLREGRFEKNQARFRRAYLSMGTQVPLDAQGRILIPSALRDEVELDREVATVGEIDFFRVWDRAQWKKQLEEDDSIFDDEEFLGRLPV